jgi:pyridoxine kinase
MPTILSIQSHVAYGHVGNSAAVFPLQRLGVEVWPVMTVHFSNHTGYGGWRGMVLPAAEVGAVVAGIEELGVFASCDAVLSGYQGSVELGRVIVDAAARVRAANPAALYCCDPVMGDVDGGFYVRPGLPAFIRDEVVPKAGIVTPNQFELEYLTGRTITTLPDALAAAAALRAMGPSVVLLTSLVRSDGPPDRIEVMAQSGDGTWIVTTPRLPIEVNGAGDMTTALFLAHLLFGAPVDEALRRTVNSVYAVLETTVASGCREIRIVEAQDAIATPPRRFDAARVG